MINNFSVDYNKKIPFLNKFISNVILKNRISMYKLLENEFFLNPNYKILDVGTTPSKSNHENILLKNYKWKNNLTCISNQNLNCLAEMYDDPSFITGDAKKMQFLDNQFEIVYSSATIEHVGSEKEQSEFIKECRRVSSKSVIITTPNRNFPIDFHTKIPFLHMLPKSAHRKILKLLGDNFFSKEENLNLLNKNEILKICKNLNLRFKIINHYFLGMISNFIIIIY